jgi:large subunit ribosomal protein L10
MPSQKNIDKVQEIKDKLNKSTAVILSDYRGLSVAQMQELQTETTKQQAEFTVVKNRLLKIALHQTEYKDGDELQHALTGPTAILYCYSDQIDPIKTVYDFAKKNELPEFKVGFLDKDFLNTNQVKSLAKLPGKAELQTKLVGTLNGPIYGFVNVLGGNIRKLVYTLQAIKDSKSESN